MIFGPFCIAFALAKNSLFVTTSLFQVVKLILFAVLGEIWGDFRMAFGTATAVVLRTVCGSFFPSLLETQDADIYDDGYESGTDSDYDHEPDYYSDQYESENECYSVSSYDQQIAVLRRLSRLVRQGRVDCRGC
jgi:hypothetical protein